MPASEQTPPTPELGHSDPLSSPKNLSALPANDRLLLSQAHQEAAEKAWE